VSDGRANNGRPPGTSGYSLPGTKKPVRSSIQIVRDIFAVIDSECLPVEPIAKKAGIHRVTISKWRSGVSSAMIRDVENVAQALGYRIVLERIEAPPK